MQESQVIWRLGRWIARRESGVAHLTWGDNELDLELNQGRIVAAYGIDPTTVSSALECQSLGHDELLSEARALAANGSISEPQAIGAAKEVIQQCLLEWMLDDARDLELEDTDVDSVEGSTISMTHAVVELVLSASEPGLIAHILPNPETLLRRCGDFLDLYAPLRLSEEADLIVAKVSGQRTAEEIASRSPHGRDETLRLICSLIATGMLEAIPIVKPPEDLHVIRSNDEYDEADVTGRRLPIALFAAGFVIIAVILGLLGLWLKSSGESSAEATQEHGAQWGIVIDLGCSPEDFSRILKTTNAHPNSTQPISIGQEAGEPCWQLAWGSYDSEDEARAEIPKIPESLRRNGFDPHPVELPDEPASLDEMPVGE